MRLAVPATTEEALAWLVARAHETWDVRPDTDLVAVLTPMARAMAALTTLDIPERIEPNAW